MPNLLLNLALFIISIAGLVCAVDIPDLFTLIGGTTNGGCNNQLQTLDDYLQEAIDSVDAALRALARYDEQSVNGMRIRQAVLTFFGIGNNVDVTVLSTNLGYVGDFVNGLNTNIDAQHTYLLCDSTYLVAQQANNQARDQLGNNIVVNGNPVLISDVREYQPYLAQNLLPWYAGPVPPINGYYFTEPNGGGGYCAAATSNLGLTAAILTLIQRGGAGTQPRVASQQYQTVVLCPNSFTDPGHYGSYADADMAITAGTTLENYVPRSSTLLHEIFHVVFGTIFLEGNQETYGLANCVLLARTQGQRAITNPENYVYFISAMYFLFGDTQSGDTGPITTYWDFTGGPDHAHGPVQQP